MKCLTIDMGNTRSKIGIFFDDRLEDVVMFDNEHSDMAGWFAAERFDEAIVCSVADQQRTVELMASRHGIITLSHSTPLPIRISYSTPLTLGLDRIAAAVGAWKHFGANCLVVDAGTAITFDLVRADGTFMGGNIAPGLSLRYKSLSEHTARLPLLNPMLGSNLVKIGDSTENAIRCGVEYGVCAEMEYWYKLAGDMMGNTIIVVTGGEGEVLCQRCRKDLPVRHEPNLVHYGLYWIVDYINNMKI